MAATSGPANASEKVTGAVLSPNMTTAFELRNPPGVNVKTSPASVPQSCPLLPNEAWIQVCATDVVALVLPRTSAMKWCRQTMQAKGSWQDLASKHLY